jgi:hypothetical protein
VALVPELEQREPEQHRKEQHRQDVALGERPTMVVGMTLSRNSTTLRCEPCVA